jgi:FXSXX-COOH protein
MNTLFEQANSVTPLVDLSAVSLSTLRTMDGPDMQHALRQVVEQAAVPQLYDNKRDVSWRH